MDFFETLLGNPWIAAVDIISMVSSVLLLLFMNFSAKHRNKKLTAGWYICGFFFPIITFFVFLSQRKKFPGPTTKVCYQCENRYPENFEMCTRCLIDLPEIDREENAKNEKKAKTFFIGYIVATVITFVAGILLGISVAATVEDELTALGTSRLGVDDGSGNLVYYDKMGNFYEDPFAVVIYDKDGNAYTYTTETGEFFEEAFYVNEQGDKYESYSCYVDLEGNFFYDSENIISYEYAEGEYIEEYYGDDESEDELYTGEDTDTVVDSEMYGDIYDDIMAEIENYRYYDDLLTDGKGNYYYWAEDASWNEKGELITAENDPAPPMIP